MKKSMLTVLCALTLSIVFALGCAPRKPSAAPGAAKAKSSEAHHDVNHTIREMP